MVNKAFESLGTDARVLGVIYLKDVVKQGMRERFDAMRRMGIRTVMITGDNPLTAKAIADEAEVDDFLAEATPEDKLTLIKQEQQGGRLVAMTGDGTNDAPALAQADVAVAMNTGTTAAKEAGNMADLDSDPTKLIEIVEIGKQLLITRSALTTFSIADDMAEYFAIIPAMFVALFPGLDPINIMRLHSPQSAILSAVTRSAAIGRLQGVDGSRPFCTGTGTGVGAVLSVIGPRDPRGSVIHPTRVISVNEPCTSASRPFLVSYHGVRVECADENYAIGQIVPIRGAAPDHPPVPADAVTAGGSGLDPDISPAYADIQVTRMALARHVTADQIRAIVDRHRRDREMGFFGEPRVNVVALNRELDQKYPGASCCSGG